MRILLALLLLALMTAACRSRSQEVRPAGTTPTSVTSSPEPATPTATATPTARPTADEPEDGLTFQRALVFFERSFLGDRLHVYDLDRRELILSRPFVVGPGSVQMMLTGGGRLLVAAAGRVWVEGLTGKGARDLWHVPPGSTRTGVAISPDGSTVAIGYESIPLFIRERSGLVVVRVSDGKVIREFGPELFDLLKAAPAPLAWQGGGSELVLQAVTHTDSGRFGWARLNGSFGSFPYEQYMATDESGTFSAFGDGLLSGCSELMLAARTIAIVDTRTGQTMATLEGGDRMAYYVFGLAADGRALVARYPVGQNQWGPCAESRDDFAIWDGTTLQPINDRLGLMLSFRGLPDIRLDCPNDADERWHWPDYMECTSGPDGELRIDGQTIGRFLAIRIVGVIER